MIVEETGLLASKDQLNGGTELFKSTRRPLRFIYILSESMLYCSVLITVVFDIGSHFSSSRFLQNVSARWRNTGFAT